MIEVSAFLIRELIFFFLNKTTAIINNIIATAIAGIKKTMILDDFLFVPAQIRKK